MAADGTVKDAKVRAEERPAIADDPEANQARERLRAESVPSNDFGKRDGELTEKRIEAVVPPDKRPASAEASGNVQSFLENFLSAVINESRRYNPETVGPWVKLRQDLVREMRGRKAGGPVNELVVPDGKGNFQYTQIQRNEKGEPIAVYRASVSRRQDGSFEMPTDDQLKLAYSKDSLGKWLKFAENSAIPAKTIDLFFSANGQVSEEKLPEEKSADRSFAVPYANRSIVTDQGILLGSLVDGAVLKPPRKGDGVLKLAEGSGFVAENKDGSLSYFDGNGQFRRWEKRSGLFAEKPAEFGQGSMAALRAFAKYQQEIQIPTLLSIYSSENLLIAPNYPVKLDRDTLNDPSPLARHLEEVRTGAKPIDLGLGKENGLVVEDVKGLERIAAWLRESHTAIAIHRERVSVDLTEARVRERVKSSPALETWLDRRGRDDATWAREVRKSLQIIEEMEQQATALAFFQSYGFFKDAVLPQGVSIGVRNDGWPDVKVDVPTDPRPLDRETAKLLDGYLNFQKGLGKSIAETATRHDLALTERRNGFGFSKTIALGHIKMPKAKVQLDKDGKVEAIFSGPAADTASGQPANFGEADFTAETNPTTGKIEVKVIIQPKFAELHNIYDWGAKKVGSSPLVYDKLEFDPEEIVSIRTDVGLQMVKAKDLATKRDSLLREEAFFKYTFIGLDAVMVIPIAAGAVGSFGADLPIALAARQGAKKIGEYAIRSQGANEFAMAALALSGTVANSSNDSDFANQVRVARMYGMFALLAPTAYPAQTIRDRLINGIAASRGIALDKATALFERYERLTAFKTEQFHKELFRTAYTREIHGLASKANHFSTWPVIALSTGELLHKGGQISEAVHLRRASEAYKSYSERPAASTSLVAGGRVRLSDSEFTESYLLRIPDKDRSLARTMLEKATLLRSSGLEHSPEGKLFAAELMDYFLPKKLIPNDAIGDKRKVLHGSNGISDPAKHLEAHLDAKPASIQITAALALKVLLQDAQGKMPEVIAERQASTFSWELRDYSFEGGLRQFPQTSVLQKLTQADINRALERHLDNESGTTDRILSAAVLRESGALNSNSYVTLLQMLATKGTTSQERITALTTLFSMPQVLSSFSGNPKASGETAQPFSLFISQLANDRSAPSDVRVLAAQTKLVLQSLEDDRMKLASQLSDTSSLSMRELSKATDKMLLERQDLVQLRDYFVAAGNGESVLESIRLGWEEKAKHGSLGEKRNALMALLSFESPLKQGAPSTRTVELIKQFSALIPNQDVTTAFDSLNFLNRHFSLSEIKKTAPDEFSVIAASAATVLENFLRVNTGKERMVPNDGSIEKFLGFFSTLTELAGPEEQELLRSSIRKALDGPLAKMPDLSSRMLRTLALMNDEMMPNVALRLLKNGSDPRIQIEALNRLNELEWAGFDKFLTEFKPSDLTVIDRVAQIKSGRLLNVGLEASLDKGGLQKVLSDCLQAFKKKEATLAVRMDTIKAVQLIAENGDLLPAEDKKKIFAQLNELISGEHFGSPSLISVAMFKALAKLDQPDLAPMAAKWAKEGKSVDLQLAALSYLGDKSYPNLAALVAELKPISISAFDRTMSFRIAYDSDNGKINLVSSKYTADLLRNGVRQDLAKIAYGYNDQETVSTVIKSMEQVASIGPFLSENERNTLFSLIEQNTKGLPKDTSVQLRLAFGNAMAKLAPEKFDNIARQQLESPSESPIRLAALEHLLQRKDPQLSSLVAGLKNVDNSLLSHMSELRRQKKLDGSPADSVVRSFLEKLSLVRENRSSELDKSLDLSKRVSLAEKEVDAWFAKEFPILGDSRLKASIDETKGFRPLAITFENYRPVPRDDYGIFIRDRFEPEMRRLIKVATSAPGREGLMAKAALLKFLSYPSIEGLDPYVKSRRQSMAAEALAKMAGPGNPDRDFVLSGMVRSVLYGDELSAPAFGKILRCLALQTKTQRLPGHRMEKGVSYELSAYVFDRVLAQEEAGRKWQPIIRELKHQQLRLRYGKDWWKYGRSSM